MGKLLENKNYNSSQKNINVINESKNWRIILDEFILNKINTATT